MSSNRMSVGSFTVRFEGVLLILLGTFFTLSVLSPGTDAQTNLGRDTKLKRTETIKRLPITKNRFALIVGINEYQNVDVVDLEGAANDARDVEQVLVRYAGFPEANVITLISDRTATNQSVEALPTKANILETLSDLLARAKYQGGDSLVFVSFSGHGLVLSGQSRKQAFLLPMDGFISRLDSTAIKLSDIRDEIEQSGIEQVMFVIDACRSNPEVSRSTNDNLLTTEYPASLDFRKRNKDIKAFATLYATGIEQRAYEYYEGKKKRGYFTSVFVEAMSGAAANERGEITLATLIDYLERVVPSRVQYRNKDRMQFPFSDIEGYRANELVIAFSDQQYSAVGTSSNKSQSFSNPPLAPRPLGSSSSPRSHTVTISDLTFTLDRCSLIASKMSGRFIECDLLVTNNGKEKVLYIKTNSMDGITDVLDNLGNRYGAAEVLYMGRKDSYGLFVAASPNTSRSIKLVFRDVAELSTNIKSLRISWTLGEGNSKASYNQPEVIFSDVPLENTNRSKIGLPGVSAEELKNISANPIYGFMWLERNTTSNGLPVFLEFEPGGRVRTRTPKDRIGYVASNETWYRTGDTVYILRFEGQKLVTEYKGDIKGDRIEGTWKSLKTESTHPWLLTKVIE